MKLCTGQLVQRRGDNTYTVADTGETLIPTEIEK